MSALDAWLAQARQALAEEDLHGALAWIELPLHGLEAQTETAASAVLAVYAGVLAAWVDEQTAELARAAAAAVDDPDTLGRLGAQLLARGELAPACGVLARASRRDPERASLWHERVAAEELRGRYGVAAALLEGAPERVRGLPSSRYLYAFARIMEGDPAPARAEAPVLCAEGDARLRFMGRRLRAMLLRHDALAPETMPNPEARARAWHAVWNGEAVMDPLGTGRPTIAQLRASLDAVAEALTAWGLRPVAVTTPRDRDSEVLGRALAEVLGVSFAARDARPDGEVLVAVWDLGSLSREELASARALAEGRVLYVHQGRGDEELSFAADLIGRLAGPHRAPWGHDAEVLALVGEPTPSRDPRPLSEIAAEVVACKPSVFEDREGWRGLLRVLAELPGEARPVGLGGRGERGRRWRAPAVGG